MKIIYFTQFYPPESIAAAFRAKENADFWSKQGNSVTVFTGFPNYPKGKLFEGYKIEKLKEETDGNIRVLRSKIIVKPNTSFFRRIINATSFWFYGLLNINFKRKIIKSDYDVVLATSGPIFTALLGYRFAKKHKIPFIFEIRDITYKQLIATGKKEKSFAVLIMKKMELFLCKKANKIVVVTNGFKKILVSDGIPENKIEVITNGVEVEKEITFNPSHTLSLSYFGTLGISQNVEETLEYIDLFAEFFPDFTYKIIGDGAQKESLQKKIKEKENVSIELLGGMSQDELETFYEKTNLSIVKLVNSENFKYTIPSKLFQIMGRGIPVLFFGPEGECSQIINDANAGITLTSQSIEENKKMLCTFLKQKNIMQVLMQMGKNGRKVVCEKYSRSLLSTYYLSLLKEAVNKK